MREDQEVPPPIVPGDELPQDHRAGDEERDHEEQREAGLAFERAVEGGQPPGHRDDQQHRVISPMIDGQ
jgi:hypothetical protein